MEDDTDEFGAAYLADWRQRVLSEQQRILTPLNTTGDGSCLLHACSRALWGVELFSTLLRHKIVEELEANKAWYVQRVGEGDWQSGVDRAKGDHEYLSTLHIVALAHVVRRPIILFASQARHRHRPSLHRILCEAPCFAG